MLGGLIESNVSSSPGKRRDFERLRAKVGIDVQDIGESVTLHFRGGSLIVADGLHPPCDLTIHADSDTVLELSNLRIGPFGMPVYVDEVGRDVASKLLGRRLRIDGMLAHVPMLNRVTRVFSVR
jgi:hypothetical protein